MHVRLTPLLALVALLVAGCGGEDWKVVTLTASAVEPCAAAQKGDSVRVRICGDYGNYRCTKIDPLTGHTTSRARVSFDDDCRAALERLRDAGWSTDPA